MIESNTLLIYFLGFMDLFGVSMVAPLLVSYCLSLGASFSLAGLISSVYAFIQFFSGPLIGKYSDMVGRRVCLQLCFLVSFLSYLMLSSSTSLYIILLSRVPLGIFKHTQDLCKAYIADHYGSKQRSEILGRFNSISNIGFIIGPLFASFLLDRFDVPVLTTLLLEETVTKVQYTSKSKFTYKQNIGRAFSFVSRTDFSFFWFILSLRFLLSFSVFSSRYDHSLYLTPKELGIVTAIAGLASTISGFLVGSITKLYQQNLLRLILHASIIQGLSIAGLTFYNDIFNTVLFTLPMSFSNALLKVSLTTLTLDSVSKRGVGVVMGMGTSTVAVSRFLAPLLAGFTSNINSNASGIAGFMASFSASILLVVTCSGVKNRI